MLNVQLICPEDLDYLNRGVREVVKSLPPALDGTVTASYSETPGLCANIAENGGAVTFSRPCELFRGIGLVASGMLNKEKPHIIREDNPFKTLGVMYDCSRNSVPTIKTLKAIMGRMALMGYNTLMLYTEDTYTVESRPEFGHYRGRYSPAELRAIDDYAYGLGIELIPCIQALTHLERFLRWPCTLDIQDNDYILLAEDEKVYALIEDMILSISGCVRSDRIHLGLDEAHGLGLGRYLGKHGYKKPEEIMKTHLSVIKDICRKHGLKPLMWGDMIFRMHIDGGGYYDPNVELPGGTGDIIPREFGLIYWDYYHTDEAFYLKYIEQYEKQGLHPLFAGGVCSWVGMVPNLVRTAATTRAGVSACKKTGIDEMFLCVWKDDGGEALPGADSLGMLMYAENCYSENGAAEEALRRNAPVMTGAPYDSFMAVGSIDEILEGVSLTLLEAPNPHKYFLWQDILLGQFDREAGIADFSAVYKEKAMILKKAIDARDYAPDALYGLKLGYCLCRVLESKVDMGIRLKAAYDKGDRKALQALRDEIAGEYKKRVYDLFAWHRESWSHFYKPFGWEVADIKYGYLLARADTACRRLDAYLDGSVERLEEMEEERLTYAGTLPDKDPRLPHFNHFSDIATVGQF
jgi:hexosaminidase